jgi:hypothetical protein
MPSKTPEQARFMAACSHGAGYESCPPQKVSSEFNQADKGSAMLSRAMKGRKKYQLGGMAAGLGAAGTALNQPPTGGGGFPTSGPGSPGYFGSTLDPRSPMAQPGYKPPQQATPDLASMIANLKNANPGATGFGGLFGGAGGAGTAVPQGPGSFGYADPNQPPPTGIPPSLWSSLIQQNNNLPPSMRGGFSGPVQMPPGGGGALGGMMSPPPTPTPPGGPQAGPVSGGGAFGNIGSIMGAGAGGAGPMQGFGPGGAWNAGPAGGPSGMGNVTGGNPFQLGPGGVAAGGVRPPMAGGMLSQLGPQLAAAQQGGIGRAPAMRPPMVHPGMMRPMPFQGMRAGMRARGGRISPPGGMPTLPGQMPGQMMRPPSPLQSLISGPMAGQHAGFPGARRPRIPLPGAMRNINQSINRSKERLGSFKV